MLIVTSVTDRNVRTDRMRKSFERFGYEVADSRPKGQGRRERDKSVYDLLQRAKSGHEVFCYSDAADTICQKEFTLPKNKILFAAEKKLWPKEDIKDRYPKSKSMWKYLNGGVWGGPIELMLEFWDKYRNKYINSPENGQHILHLCFLEAKEDGFPIALDTRCRYFQCIAHEGINPEFKRGEKGELITNVVNKTTPAIFHGNGTTEMNWIEKQVM